ncbi:MAG: methylmalonyl-CoA mutase family protein, partial [Cetobacterium sp.]
APLAIEKGYIQQEIMDSAYKYQKEIENEEKIIVGVNKFQIEEEAPKGLLRVDPIVGERQKDKLEELRQNRDNKKVRETLQALEKACSSNENLMPYILDAVKVYATLGEICGVMREVFGEYKQAVMI